MELNVHELDALTEILHKDRYKVMQFTGIYDKNKKELYKGDIFSHNLINWVVVFSGKQGVMLARKIERNTTWKSLMDINNISKYIEIIGNIYENPELINGAS